MSRLVGAVVGEHRRRGCANRCIGRLCRGERGCRLPPEALIDTSEAGTRRDRVNQGLSAARPRGLTRPRRAPISRGTRHSTHLKFVAGLGSRRQSSTMRCYVQAAVHFSAGEFFKSRSFPCCFVCVCATVFA
jgi:hypothetical protein